MYAFIETLTEGAVTTEAGSLFCISQPSLKIPTISFGGGSHIGVPSIGGGGHQVRIKIQKALEYLEFGNEVIPKSSTLQGMKVQSLQSLFVGEVTHASNQHCSLSLNSLLIVDICNEVCRPGWHTIFEVLTPRISSK